MPELRPYPLALLATRMFQELERENCIFGMPRDRFFLGDENHDFSVDLHGHVISSPLGPAAGPHTQMAQNIVLSWLAGGRCLELKTVQIMDRLTIPRPCIDMRTVGFNAEWSQELRLGESLEEYVKASMLIDLLQASNVLELSESYDATLWDLSVGYDLEGIQSESVGTFMHGMIDATESVARLRRQLPSSLAKLEDLSFRTAISDTLTLSTFHGCPPDEIERIAEFILRELGLHCVVKFNPMLLGAELARGILNDSLGYSDLRIPDSAFERDATWDQAVGMVERLQRTATEEGLSFGVKFTNTLIVENNQGFLPKSEAEVYLSGPPLHVLAMELVRRFRQHFGDRFPISFSAGIDRTNFADASALGLAPITVCTDLLKKGGYGRLPAYHQALAKRMLAVSAKSSDEFILRAYGLAEQALEGLSLADDHPARASCLQALEQGRNPLASLDSQMASAWLSKVKLLNTEHYVSGLLEDPRYGLQRNAAPPKKIGRHLLLFDCLTCDICIPVCPNDANFNLPIPSGSLPIIKANRTEDGWICEQEGELPLAERHQIATFADFCNECGNCDVFCPEDGGPYVVKPHFFGHLEDWQEVSADGFHLVRDAESDIVFGRFKGVEYRLESQGDDSRFIGRDFSLSFSSSDLEGTLHGEGPPEVDLTYALIMDTLRRAIFDRSHINYLNTAIQ